MIESRLNLKVGDMLNPTSRSYKYVGSVPGDVLTVTHVTLDGGSFGVKNERTGLRYGGCAPYDTYYTPIAAAATLKAVKTWTPKPVSRNSKLYRKASSPALRKVGAIRKLLNNGKSVRWIAGKLGLSKSAVGRVAQRIAA